MTRALLAVVLGLLGGCGSEGRAARAPAAQVAERPQPGLAPDARAVDRTAPAVSPARGFGPTIGFRSRRLLLEHVAKHGAEFGTADARAYLRLAQALRDTTVGGPIVEAHRADGITTRYDRSAGSFIAFNPDGTIRTFFRPNDGEQYFRRQARRGPPR